jgi:hypothetical protein
MRDKKPERLTSTQLHEKRQRLNEKAAEISRELRVLDSEIDTRTFGERYPSAVDYTASRLKLDPGALKETFNGRKGELVRHSNSLMRATRSFNTASKVFLGTASLSGLIHTVLFNINPAGFSEGTKFAILGLSLTSIMATMVALSSLAGRYDDKRAIKRQLSYQIRRQCSVSGSPVGDPHVISKMLEFAAMHNIQPVTETFDMADVNKAIARLRKGDIHYRAVLKN